MPGPQNGTIMKTADVNKDLIGRRCECISFGTVVTGVIEDIMLTIYTVEIKVRYDEPQCWGQEILYSGWSQGNKEDDSGSLQYVRLLPEPIVPNYETLVITFAEPIRTLERHIFDEPQAWGVATLKEWVDSYESTRFTQIGDRTAVITSEYNMRSVREWLEKHTKIKTLKTA